MRSGSLKVATLWRPRCDNGGGSGRGRVERLSLAAGRNGDTPDHLWRYVEAAIAGRGRDGQFKVEIGKVRLLQVKRRVAREMLRGEVEERELAETGLVRVVGISRAGDRGGREEVLSGEIERNLRIGPVRHLHIEDDIVAAKAEIADTRQVRCRAAAARSA